MSTSQQKLSKDNRLGLARIFHIRILLGGILPIVARDSYVDHHGRMLVKLVDLFTLADGMGEEYDIGELVTYLNDAVLVAPSMLLVPEVLGPQLTVTLLTWL